MTAVRTSCITARELVVGYRRRRRDMVVATASSLTARAGCLTVVVGPNGAGKSTLLRTLVGAQPALAGQVEVDGEDLHRLDRAARARKLAVVLTDRVDPGLLTVGDVVGLGRYPHTGWYGRLHEADVAVARRAADVVGVGALWDRRFALLSDGQRQRVMVARALAQEPRVLVLDEPTAFLDVPGRLTLTALLAGLAADAGVAVLLSTHDLDLALGRADALWLVHDGRVRAGAPREMVWSGEIAAALDGGEPGLRAELERTLRQRLDGSAR